MSKPSVLVVSGHRSYGDAGNPTEKSLTPAMSAAYEKALEAAGYRVTHLQREFDGDSDPDDTVGGLDTVGQKCAAWMARTPGSLVMLDCHYEGSSAPGVFAIVPDKTGLGTAINVPQPSNDTWASNMLDVQLAREISREISKATGLPLRTGIREPGVMSETQTGVAGQYNARLAMFAYTAPYRDRAVRLVVEHGSLPVASDREIIMRPNFTDKCAAAVVRAMNTVFAEGSVLPEPPKEEPVSNDNGYVPGMDEGIASMLFGKITDDKGVYQFNPNGPVSKAWLAHGRATGEWPGLKAVRSFDDGTAGRTYFLFEGGWTLWRAGNGPVAELK